MTVPTGTCWDCWAGAAPANRTTTTKTVTEVKKRFTMFSPCGNCYFHCQAVLAGSSFATRLWVAASIVFTIYGPALQCLLREGFRDHARALSGKTTAFVCRVCCFGGFDK